MKFCVILVVVSLHCIVLSFTQDLRAFPDDDRCSKKVNIGFVLDSSKSMSSRDYRKQKEFVKSLVSTFNISPYASQAGAIVYSDDAVITAKFGQFPYLHQFKQAVDDFDYMGKRTRIDKALNLATKTLFTWKAGARLENENIMVILTDGLQTMDPDAVPLRDAARPVHDNNIRVFAIGVGHHYNRSQLRDIVERDQDLFEAENFDALLNLVKKIARGTCAPAPVVHDGGWSSWQQWDACVPECGGGLQTRIRLCNNPPQSTGGRPCEGVGQQTRICNQQPCEGKVQCTARADIGFVMDASKSIGPRDFQKEKDFVKGIAGAFNFAPDQTIAGVVSYSTNASLEVALGQYMSVKRFKLAVDRIKKSNGQTRIDKALFLTHKDLFGRSRPGYPKVMIILTDGVQTTDPDAIPLDKAAEPLHRAGVRVFAVGVGGQINETELRLMVRRDDDVFTAKDFDDLLQKTYQIAQRTCPVVHGGWSFWGRWDKCTQTCGTGKQLRRRVCNNPVPENGGNQCPGISTAIRLCNQQSCAVDGKWGYWSPWSNCDRECGGGNRARTRTCSNPPPKYGGRGCFGPSTETESCNDKPCPVHGSWSSWSDYDTCIPECGGGKQTRRRSCDNPPRRYGGRPCIGLATESRVCNEQPCPVKCSAEADIGFVMDASKSIGKRDFEKQRDFVKSVADSFTFAPDQTIAGVVSYSTNASLEVALGQYMSVKRFKLAVDRIKKSNGQTRIDKALFLTHKDLFGRSRPGYPKVMIILTDGVQTTDPDAIPLDKAAEPLHRAGVRVFAVGVGGQINETELRLMVRRDDDVFAVHDFDDLLEKTFQIAQRTCESVAQKVDGEWSQWGLWDKCIPECGGGRQMRQRSCTNPPPNHGGRFCLGSRTQARACNQQPCSENIRQCSAKADIAFLMDASNSIGERDFQKQRDFVKGVASSYEFAKNQAIAAVITYSTNAKVSIPLGKYMAVEDFKLEVDRIGYTLGQTRIDKALKLARTDIFSIKGGTRFGFPKILIILTDGLQTEDHDALDLGEAVKPLRQEGVKIFAIGVGPNINQKELLSMVENPNDVFTVNDFDDLLQKTYIIAQRTCSRIEEPPVPPSNIVYSSWSQWKDWNKCIPECGGGKQTRRRVCKNDGALQCPGREIETRACNQQPCINITCSARADLSFLMDDSGSIGSRDFQKERDFVKAVAGSFTFARDQTLASVIKYNQKATLEIPLGRHLSSESFRLSVDQIPYTLGQTRIDRALHMAAKKVFSIEGGSRPGFPKILIIITDGMQTKDPDSIDLREAVKPLQRAGVLVLAVGIGAHVDPQQLRKMVLRSSDIYNVTDFDDLLNKAYVIAQRTCNVIRGPRVHGGWSPWSGWTKCSLSCGRGRQSRARVCDNPLPSNGGYACQGSKQETRYCNTIRCSDRIGGQWTTWSVWQPCSASCGKGRQYRLRYCYSLYESEGRPCIGNSREGRICSLGPCLDGRWSQWSVWQPCSITCGGGRQYRSRSCTNPAPVNAGKYCDGRTRESRFCATTPCPRYVRDGGWTQWSAWQRCSKTCGGGIQYRSRSCTDPKPSNGGKYCNGQSLESRFCSTTPCSGRTSDERCHDLNGEVLFILTSSKNVGASNFLKQKTFVKRTAASYGVTPKGTTTGVVSYDDNVRVHVDFGDYSDLFTLNRAIDNINYNSLGDRRIDKALAVSSKHFFPSKGLVSYNVPRMIILFINGRQTKDHNSIPLSRVVLPLHNAKVKVFVIAVGPSVNPRELQVIVGDRANVFRVRDFDDLLRRHGDFIRKTCSSFLPKLQPPCLGATDLGFVLDSSESIGASNFEKQRQFVKDFSLSFGVGSLTTNVGVITHMGSFGFVHFRFLDYHSLDEIRQALDRIPYTVGQSRLDLAMDLAINDLFTVSGGARWDIPKVLVILTDGIQRQASKLSRAAIKLSRAGVKVLVFGVGSVDPTQLRALVQSEKDMVIVNKFDDLLSRSHELALRTCNDEDVRGSFPPSPGPTCQNNMDVAFALDSSWEIKPRNYQKQKQFVKEMGSYVGYTAYGSRIGVLAYGDTSLIEVRLDHQASGKKFNRKIDQMPYYSQRRRIDKALTTASLLYKFPTTGGNDPGSKVLVLIAGGRRTLTRDALPLWEAVNPLKKAGVKIIAIGVGSDLILQNQLKLLTDKRNVFIVPNFEVLLKQTRNFKRIICEAGALNKQRRSF